MAKRRVHTPEFKAKVALEALSGNKTLAEVAAIHRLHPVQVCQWKQQVTKRLPDLYRNSDSIGPRESAEKLILKIDKLEQTNAALIQELEWTKKKFYSYDQQILRSCLEPGHRSISLRRQCELLGASRSSYYYQPAPAKAKAREVAHQIDDLCGLDPAMSTRMLLAQLNSKGMAICKNYLHRLLCRMGFAPYERKLTKLFSDRFGQLQHSPHWRKGVAQSGEQWILDIAYWPCPRSERFAALLVDCHSQKCLAWGLSDSLACGLAMDVLKVAMEKHPLPLSLRCETFLPLLSDRFLGSLRQEAICIVGPLWLDRPQGVGRATLLAPLWRSLKLWARRLQAGNPHANEEWVLNEAISNLNVSIADNICSNQVSINDGSAFGLVIGQEINDPSATLARKRVER
jgi:putative transposase